MTVPPPTHLPERAADPDALDRDEVLGSLDGSEQLMADVIASFVAEAPALLGAIREAVAARDGARLARAARTLRSRVGDFRAVKAMRDAAALERLGARAPQLDDHDVSRASLLVATAAASVTRMVETLPAFVADAAA